jgi:L-threonylcarbamoyladenylate synthase
MITIIKTPIPGNISEAASLLAAGEIVAIPTETVYGLAANALNPAAIEKIFIAKGRPRDNPLIVHVADWKMLQGLGLEIPKLAERLADRLWPGPLTMIFKKKSTSVIPGEVSCGLDTVAVRFPAHTVMLKIIEQCKFPLAAPSANISGSPSPTKAEHVFADLNGKIPLIIDGGDCLCGVESTVVMFDRNKIRILRPGAVTPEMLSEFGEVLIDETAVGASIARPISPGTRHKHYAPRAKVFAVEGDVAGMGEFIIAEPEAHSLYAKLREFDDLGAKQVYIRLPEPVGIGLALYNRIVRAAEFKIMKAEK